MFGCIKTSLVAAFLERYVFKSGILMGLKLFKRVKINVAGFYSVAATYCLMLYFWRQTFLDFAVI